MWFYIRLLFLEDYTSTVNENKTVLIKKYVNVMHELTIILMAFMFRGHSTDLRPSATTGCTVYIC